MAKERTSVRMQAQIKLMSEQGHSIRSIARVLKLSRRTVRKYLEPVGQPPSEGGGWEEAIDWDYARQEVYGKGTTVKQIQRKWGSENNNDHLEDNPLPNVVAAVLQQATAGHVGEGAHFMGRTHGLNFAQIVGGQLIEAGDAEQSHGGHDFVFQYFEHPY
jgi:Homeodomain-like domain-containing protein